jgi:apolipoprotein N-acyltransferase
LAEQPHESSTSYAPVLLAAGSGALQALSFPKFSLLPLGILSFFPLLIFTAREPSSTRRFLGGFLAGTVFFAATCYWLYTVQAKYGGLNPFQAGGILLILVIYLALYWGVFAWLCGNCWQVSWGPAAVPALWVALEYARAHVATGFPWLLSGYVLTDFYPLARLAHWTGVYGLSYLAVALPVAILWPFLKPSKMASLHLVGVLVLVTAFALSPVDELPPATQRAFLVQANVPQAVAFEPWDSRTQEPLFARLDKLTLGAVPEQKAPALVVWPEMPAHFYFHDDGFTRPYVERLARQTDSTFLIGAVTHVAGSHRQKALNSSILLAPSGKLISQYDKIHLVPFGEYVPWRERLAFAESLTAEVSDFTPGHRLVVSDIPGGKLATIICYEAIFPDLVRRFVREGAGVLVNISNDGWFGTSAARHQHLLQSRMRAVENDRYLLRATNTGITALISPHGKIAEEIPPDREGVLKGTWAFRTNKTFYAKHGDIFAMACSVLALLASLISFAKMDGSVGGKSTSGRRAGKKRK